MFPPSCALSGGGKRLQLSHSLTGTRTLRRYSGLLEDRGFACRASVLDVFAGSGALALTAALEGAREVTAVDISRRAILNARLNARLNRVRLRALCGDLFAPVVRHRFDLIVANPRYVPSESNELPRRGKSRRPGAGAFGASKGLVPGGGGRRLWAQPRSAARSPRRVSDLQPGESDRAPPRQPTRHGALARRSAWGLLRARLARDEGGTAPPFRARMSKARVFDWQGLSRAGWQLRRDVVFCDRLL
jgi:SAM-dependent methyltransferase